MRLLVTGGAGFIGSNFARCALADLLPVEKLVNLDLLSYAGNLANLKDIEADPRYQFVQGDIGDLELVANLLREHQITHVVNFAAESHVDRSIEAPEVFVRANVLATVRLLQSVRIYWEAIGAQKELFRFLHISTDEVYGSLLPDDQPFSEKTAFAPNSPYAASKAAADHLVRAFYHTYQLPVLTTNCSNNYGPYQFPEKLIPLMILNALELKPLPIYGKGANVRDWLYVEDHCRAIALVLRKGNPGETYCVGGGCELPNIQVVDLLCELLDQLAPREDKRSYSELKSFVTDRKGHDMRYAIDFGKIQSELGWRPSHDFKAGLKKTVEWYLQNRAWCDDITQSRYQRERLGL